MSTRRGSTRRGSTRRGSPRRGSSGQSSSSQSSTHRSGPRPDAETSRADADPVATRTRRRWAADTFFGGREPAAAKVPEIIALFWVIKIVTTAMGESTSDWLGDVSIPAGAVVEVAVMAAALWLQFRSRRYRAASYWFLAVAIAIFGTGVSDTLHIAVGIPYVGTTALWAVVLATIFWRWHRSEGTLSIHSITTLKRERYYWATVFATFALGTALGDLTATELQLGFLASGLLFLGIILLPLVAWRWFGLNSVVAFWIAYVDTRPLGASFSDYISKPHNSSGAAFGDIQTTIVLTAAVVALVVYVGVRRHDRQPPLI